MDKITEKQNPKSDNLDLLSIDEILYLINEEDRKISKAVRANIPLINELIEDNKMIRLLYLSLY